MVCPKCGQALPEDSEFCQYCGSKLAGTSVPAGNAAPASAPELAGKTCPFCKAPFMEGEAVVFCSHCEMPHHLECWKENGGCTTFGCTGNIGKIIGAEQKNAQSAPVATRRPAAPEAPRAVPYPTSRSVPQNAAPKQERVAPKPEPPVEQKDVILAENTDRIIQGNIPVLLERSRIQKAADGKLYATCSFIPLTDKRIQAMQVDVQCADIWRERVKSVEGYQYLDLRTSRDTPFGLTEKISLPDSNTRVIDVIIQKIMFADGTLIQQAGKPDTNPNPVPLSEVLNEELLEEYKAETYQNARFVPVSLGQIWVCTCGAINREEEGDCHLCGDSLASLTSHLDKDMLQKSVDEKKRIQREKEERERIAREEALRLKKEKAERERKEREERLRIQREKEAAEAAERKRLAEEKARAEAEEARKRAEARKKRNKKIAIICSAAALLALIVYLVGWQIVPSVRYKNAEAALAAGEYDAAYEGFLKVGGYRDGEERANATRYEQAQLALESGDFDAAYTYFSEISGYEDSATMAKEAIYQKALKLIKNGDYAAAKELLEQIKGYSKSGVQITLCEKAIKYNDSKALFDSGKYEQAAKSFEVNDYLDSKDYAQRAYYLYAKELIEKGKLHEAYAILRDKVNKNGKSSFEDSAELANSVEYQYATKCMAAGKYEDAYSSFANIKGYEDSEAQYLEAGYQYGLQLFEKKSYDKAVEVFASLDKYKDSVKQGNESKYQYALSLQSKGEYDKAIKLFTELGNYSDSAKQIKETKYQQALAYLKKKEYSKAEKLFAELGNYSDSAKQLKETKYQYAQSLVSAGKYTQAVPIYKELGNYSDSLEKWKATMWAYVKAHKNNDDKTTYEYLTALKRYNYQSSKAYYDELYTWRITGFVNTSTSDTKTKLTSVNSWTQNVTFHYTLTGGPPGGTITLYHIVVWPDGSSSKQSYTWDKMRDGSTFTSYWDGYFWNDPGRDGRSGTLTSKIYDKATGQLIGTVSIRVSY